MHSKVGRENGDQKRNRGIRGPHKDSGNNKKEKKGKRISEEN